MVRTRWASKIKILPSFTRWPCLTNNKRKARKVRSDDMRTGRFEIPIIKKNNKFTQKRADIAQLGPLKENPFCIPNELSKPMLRRK